VGRFERLRRWVQRKPALAASLAAAVVLLIAASAFLFYWIGAAGRADSEARLRGAAVAAQAQAEAERGRAEIARAALEQAQKDRALGEALDELGMVLGTLWFGFDAKETVPVLVPKYVAAFRAFGIEFERDEDAAPAIERLAALRARDEELGRVAEDGLRVLAHLSDAEGPTRRRVNALLAAVPGASWPELDAAVQRWQSSSVDDFGPLLAEEVLAGKSPEQTYRLAGALVIVPDRLGDAQLLLERLVAREPGSFRAHFLASALGFMQAFRGGGPSDEGMKAILERLLHHMDVAVALRPKSGFVRAMQANALALNHRYEAAVICMNEATSLEPRNALVWMFRARFYGFTPWPEKGVEACEKALELDPNLPGGRKLLAELEAKAKKE
jgi:tetratricopeptide (TPR) repeat protein